MTFFLSLSLICRSSVRIQFAVLSALIKRSDAAAEGFGRPRWNKFFRSYRCFVQGFVRSYRKRFTHTLWPTKQQTTTDFDCDTNSVNEWLNCQMAKTLPADLVEKEINTTKFVVQIKNAKVVVTNGLLSFGERLIDILYTLKEVRSERRPRAGLERARF